ncbi:hypothetical protein B9Q04_13135 [Candidatus Marsarchaeota G2 archaeon BE_D]|uniref:Uncharacterized protein n=3 Tax=Candidatus Marsarchaeota group 2 TaxID=2203771 RepID=A0A2R6C7Y5_9ARCH|nr:MAG: hypothetical protein B9Q06_08810 [Candidatus Marsarchaeota G2 archaeon ECH_B_2]PSO01178.1 MAG: hypothetical protein B9Q05_09225 [Candidatus Marsarchaeota G2 archaeon ECH_B_1]PSO07007.1 MAG: hypothetical protein B9Q04_13135 [Candidatus Marsarchaeota G2 archaeon BE_D]
MAQAIINGLQQMQSQVANLEGSALQHYQSGTIYQFQGVMGELCTATSARIGRHPPILSGWLAKP